MRCTLWLNSSEDICLPVDYNHIVQSWIYHSISEKLAIFLHDHGFMVGKRAFRLFCFSRLSGNYTIDHQHIIYHDRVKLVITSPLSFFLEEFVNGITLCPYIRLGRNTINVESIEVGQEEIAKSEILVRTLSPIILYSTMLRGDGRQYTVYFEPGNTDYDELLTHNLCHKYQALMEEATVVPEGMIHAVPLRGGKMNIVKYKNFIMKGFLGKIKLSGPTELLQLGIDCGIGGKNAQGFGCVTTL